MSELLEYAEVRRRMFDEIHRHPENIDQVMHNFAAVLFKGTKWPEGFSPDQVGTAIDSTIREGYMRYEFALAMQTRTAEE